LLFFLLITISPLSAGKNGQKWLDDLFGEGRNVSYKTIKVDIENQPQSPHLGSEIIEKIVNLENIYPRLYGILINLYYQKDEPHFKALLEEGSKGSCDRFRLKFLELAEFAGHQFVECFFVPGPNSDYFRQLHPRFRGKDILGLIVTSTGYFAKLDVPKTKMFANPLSTEFDRQWGLDAGRFRQAHALTKGKGVKIAIIDSGIDMSHSVFRNTRWGNHFSLVGRDGPPWSATAPAVDWGWHGTVVTSIVARYAPEAQITLYKGMDADTMNDAPCALLLASFMAASIYKAVHDSNEVINISAGLGDNFEYLRRACQYAYQNNVIIVTASPYYLGKYLGLNHTFPGQYETTISVTGIERHSDGTYGCWQAAAPEVTTTVSAPCAPFVAYHTHVDLKDEYVPGISCATPIVTSLVALAISVYPKLGTEKPGEYFERIKKILVKNANQKVFRVFCQKAAMALLVQPRQ